MFCYKTLNLQKVPGGLLHFVFTKLELNKRIPAIVQMQNTVCLKAISVMVIGDLAIKNLFSSPE